MHNHALEWMRGTWAALTRQSRNVTRGRPHFALLLPVSVVQFPWASIQELAALVKRTMNLSVTITSDTAYIGAEDAECAVSWVSLQAA
ncbi:MAG: YaeQ family protein [Proteobacteria bacterium]|nr:YaeQ family protein [Pseudomonadota bacterium]MBU1649978.1 YaeQ family protein [Pseudomonadota bacterium]MBU1987103.1 YaeQ family protein [Pseudomonadota bacterium]